MRSCIKLMISRLLTVVNDQNAAKEGPYFVMFLHGSVLSRDFRRFAQLPVLVLVHVAVHMLLLLTKKLTIFHLPKRFVSINFSDKWAKDRPWLEFRVTEDAMYCTFCEKYAAKSGNNAFRDGCKSLRLSNIKDHEKTPAHQASSEAFEVASRPLSEMPMEQCLKKMEKKGFHQMEALFTSAFYLAKKGRPFSDFPDLITLQRANGLEIPKWWMLMVMLIFFLYSIRCHEHALITASYSVLETCIHVVFIIILNLVEFMQKSQLKKYMHNHACVYKCAGRHAKVQVV